MQSLAFFMSIENVDGTAGQSNIGPNGKYISKL